MDTQTALLLTIPEVATVLHLKPAQVRVLIRQGKLNVSPEIKRNRLVTVASVERFVSEADNHVHHSAMRKQYATQTKKG